MRGASGGILNEASPSAPVLQGNNRPASVIVNLLSWASQITKKNFFRSLHIRLHSILICDSEVSWHWHDAVCIRMFFSLSNDFYAALNLWTKWLKCQCILNEWFIHTSLNALKLRKFLQMENKNINIAEFSGWPTFGKLPVITWSVVVAGQIGQRGVMARASYLHL